MSGALQRTIYVAALRNALRFECNQRSRGVREQGDPDPLEQESFYLLSKREQSSDKDSTLCTRQYPTAARTQTVAVMSVMARHNKQSQVVPGDELARFDLASASQDAIEKRRRPEGHSRVK